MNKYYVYVHRRLSDNKPFYVGKGSGNRALNFTGRNIHWYRVKNKHGIKVEVVFHDLTEDEAFQCEIDVIKEFKYFGYPLVNLTDGGEGPSGLSFTDMQRFNISNALKNKNSKCKDKSIKRPSAYGENNHFADLNKYTFIRLYDGFEINCSRHELCEKI